MHALLLLAAFSLDVQGHQRRYLLHAPPGKSAALPLVLVFHGGSDSPENMATISGFDDLADREHFLVAYPEAVDKNWNDGRGTMASAKMGIDDVEFTRRVIADIRARYAVDPRRIYATGPSNGGIFSNRLGCEMADVFAAIGPVIGTIASNLAPACHPAAPISVVGIQGVDDPLMPFAGGEEGGAHHLGRGGRIEGGRATQQLWASLDGCAAQPAVTPLPARVNDGTSVTRRTYGGCRGGVEVVWYEIEGGGHRWHGRLSPRPGVERLVQRALGVSSQNIDATETLWTFFKAHPKR